MQKIRIIVCIQLCKYVFSIQHIMDMISQPITTELHNHFLVVIRISLFDYLILIFIQPVLFYKHLGHWVFFSIRNNTATLFSVHIQTFGIFVYFLGDTPNICISASKYMHVFRIFHSLPHYSRIIFTFLFF